MSDGGKGSAPRPIPDRKKFEENWDRIFGPKDKVEKLFKGIEESDQFTILAAHKAFSKIPNGMRKQWWLVELDVHGNPTLKDGSHSSKREVEEALKLRSGLGFTKGKNYAAAEIYLSEIANYELLEVSISKEQNTR